MAIQEARASSPAVPQAVDMSSPLPLRPYLKDDRDPNEIQAELRRSFYGTEYASMGTERAPVYSIPEIVTFDPEWMDPATGLMVNVPSDPDFLSSFTLRRRHANLAIGTYAVDLAFRFPEGGYGLGGTLHGDGIMRFSISRTQIRQEISGERTAIIHLRHRSVQIKDKHGEWVKSWIPYRSYRSTEEGVSFDTVWHAGSKKARVDRMPETVGRLFFALSEVFSSMIRLHGVDPFDTEYGWTATLAQMDADSLHNAWSDRLTGVNSFAVWRDAITHLKTLKDLSKAERHSGICLATTTNIIHQLIATAAQLRYSKDDMTAAA